MARHNIDSVLLEHTDMGSPVVLGGLGALSHNPNAEIFMPDTGDVFAVDAFPVSIMPELAFNTNCLKSVIDNINHAGSCFVKDSTHLGLVGYNQKHDACAATGRAASNHKSTQFLSSQLFISSISAQRGQEAIATLVAHAKSPDGLLDPVVKAFNAVLPAVKTDDEHYTIGKMTTDYGVIDEITSLSLEYGHQLLKTVGADSIWPTKITVGKIPFKLTIQTEDPEWLGDSGKIPLTTGLVTHASTAFYFLRRETTGTPVSGGSFKDFSASVHIKGTIAGRIAVTSDDDASGSSFGSTTIEITGITGAVNPVVWDTTAAYPL